MALALTVVDHWEDTKRFHLIATLKASGNYATGGDVIPLSDPLIKSSTTPLFGVAQAGLYNFAVLPGTFGARPGTAKLQAFVDSTGVEVGNGAYPAGLLAATIQLYMIFFKV